MNTVVIHNPAAGRNRAKKKLAELRSILDRNGIEAEWLGTEGPGHARELAEQCRSNRVDLVIAAGGDGTVSEVAGSLVDPSGRAPELMVWPMGSGNDFVANTHSARHSGAWKRALLHGRTRVFDAGVLEILEPEPSRHYFFNNTGLGLEAEVIAESIKIRNLRGMPLYLVSALRALRGAMLQDLSLIHI